MQLPSIPSPSCRAAGGGGAVAPAWGLQQLPPPSLLLLSIAAAAPWPAQRSAATARGVLSDCLVPPCAAVGLRRSDKKDGALAIVLAGGYADDKDTGSQFDYTGEGGQESKKQVGS